ncbi:toll-like receptor 4 [Mytilus californianus]|uniref:toll-like receptor 4 n=1 Tax=Mytilus californianus TaxID=6549 RepID=UPI0022469F72|nr:toll-like receptor 4 [Mytilus californianus]
MFEGITSTSSLGTLGLIASLSLIILDLSNNKIDILRNGSFNGLSSLQHLNLKSNILVYKKNTFQDACFSQLKSLQVLNIENNVGFYSAGQIFPKLNDLINLDNDFSFGNYLYETLAMNISVLNVSNLFSTHDIPTGHINKRQLSSAVQGTSDFVQNYIDTVLNNGYEVNVHIPFPRNFKFFYIKRSLLRFTVPRCTLMNNSLVHVDGSENLVTAWIGPVINIKTLRYLDLSSNFCSNISDFFFQDCISIETLLIGDNLLGFIIPFDEKGNILSALKLLTKLNLAQNRIATIPRDFFKSQVALKTLDLRDNYLSDILFDIAHMNKLTKIDLSTNHISSLGVSTMKDLDDTNRKNNLTLDLSNNPLACNCKTIDFIKWISETDVHLLRRHQYECLQEDSTKILLSQPRLVYQHLEKECSSYGYVIAGVSVAIIIFIIILFFGVMYRYRWKLRYLYYMTKQKYRGYQLQQDRDETDYLYDAFISYADEDQMFVHDEMIKNLEDKFSIKLCLHKRDFTPGQDIAGNITNAIHNSRKTIVVMTENFLTSYWCMFEFNMARMETTYSRHGDKVLMMILYQPIAVKDLPLVMLELVQSESFIEYPRDHFGNDVFWMKIKEALE